MVGVLIRMKFTIARHNQSWKRQVGFVLACVAVLATWAVTLLAQRAAGPDVLGFILLVWLIGWVIGPVLTSGAAVMRPEYFTLLPLNRRRLGLAMLATVFAGVGAAALLTASLVLIGYAVVIGAPQAIPVALLSGVLFTILVVSVARIAYALLGSAMRSRVGVELAAIQYGLLIAAMFFGWMVVAPVVNAVPVFLREGFASLPAASVLTWLPGSWPVQAVESAASGDWPMALGWLGLLAVLAAAAVVGAGVMLRPHLGNRTMRRTRRPIGSRVLSRPRLLPATPLGAVVGKEIRTWLRDPWRSLEIRSSIWFGIFLALFGVVGGAPQLAGFAGIAVALMVGLSGANLYGQDGTALWQLVVTQSPAALRADVRGRQIGLILYFGLPAAVLSTIMLVITGEYGFALPIAAMLICLTVIGSGVAVLLSVTGVTPGVEPHRRVNANDAGENAFSIQIALWSVLILALPTISIAVLLMFGGATMPGWLPAATMLVALLNGGSVAYLLGRIAIGRLRTHLPETFGRLRYPGTSAVARTDTSGVLDYLSGQAVKSAAEAEALKRKTSARSSLASVVRVRNHRTRTTG